MSRRPFYKRYTGDRLMGTRDLNLEERAAYDDLLDMMYDRGQPIPDEPRWIAGFIGVSTRKWSTLRESLIAAGKIIVRGERLSNRRFERELALEEAEESAAVTWGRMGGRKRAALDRAAREALAREREPELALAAAATAPKEDGKASKTSRTSAGSEDSRDGKPREPERKPKEINGGGQGPLKPARATIFQSPERESYDSLGANNGAKAPKPKPKPKPARVKAKTARAMPKKWEPAPLTPDVEAIVAHWPEGLLLHELARFKDHAADKGRTAKNWDAAWRNWIRKADDDWKRAGARPLGKASGWNFSGNR